MLDWIKTAFAARKTEPSRRETEFVPSDWLRPSASGAYVTEDRANSISVYAAALMLSSSTLAMLPIKVNARRGDSEEDGNQRLIDHPVEHLLNREANPELSGFAFREWAVRRMWNDGGAFAEIERDTVGRPLAFWPLEGGRVSICRDDAGTLYYEVQNAGGEKVTIPARDMFHLSAPSINGGPAGVGVLGQARNDLDETIKHQQFATNYYANSASPSGMVKIKSPITPDGFARLKAQFEQLYKGPRRAGKVVFADSDWDWQAIGVSPQDSEFLASRRFSVEQIARWFLIPTQMLGDSSKLTYSNFEQASLNFLTLHVLPLVARFEAECNRKLFSEPVRGRARPFVKVNVAGVVRADLQKPYQAYALGRNWGWLSVNDVRKLEDMEPIGPDGDQYLVPLNMEPSSASSGATDDEVAERVAALIGKT